jgi:hypothetical protein
MQVHPSSNVQDNWMRLHAKTVESGSQWQKEMKKWDDVNSNTHDNKVKCFKDETDTGEIHHQHLCELPENQLLLQSH